MSVKEVRHDEAKTRYEIWVDDELAGFAEYALANSLITFTHTEIERKHEGKGAGSLLIRAALDNVRADGDRKVLPVCPFVKGWIARHQDYHDLLYGYSKPD